VSLVVKDRDGRVLHEAADRRSFSEINLQRADFSGQELEGIFLDDSDLRDADLSDSDLYWAYAFRANFGGAILRNTKLAGANLAEANFYGADLRGAYISFDNLGGSATLEGADLTRALLDDADLAGCKYNDCTRFPDGFDPIAKGMTWVDTNEIYIRPGSFASAHPEPGYYIPDPNNPGSVIPVPDKNK